MLIDEGFGSSDKCSATCFSNVPFVESDDSESADVESMLCVLVCISDTRCIDRSPIARVSEETIDSITLMSSVACSADSVLGKTIEGGAGGGSACVDGSF